MRVQDTFFIDVEQGTGCYEWFVQTNQTASDGGEQATLDGLYPLMVGENRNVDFRMWIIDLDASSDEEVSGHAYAPSEASQSLSREFYTLGEVPSLALRFLARQIDLEVDFEWDSEANVWTGSVRVPDADLVRGTVTGNSVSALHCFVQPRTFQLAVVPDDALRLLIEEPTDVSVAATAFSVHGNACSRNQIILLPGDGLKFFLSLDSFSNTRLLQLDSASVGGATRIIDATQTRETIVFLLDNGIWVTEDLVNFSPADLGETGGEAVSAIQASEVCSALRTADGEPSPTNLLVSAWIVDDTAPDFFTSADGGRTFTRQAFVDDAQAHRIISYLPLEDYAHDVFLVQNEAAEEGGEGEYQLKLRPDETSRLPAGVPVAGFRFPTTAGNALKATGSAATASSVSMALSTSGSGALLIFADTLYATVDGGWTAHRIVLRSRNPARPASELAAGEFIVSVTTDELGNMAVLTSNERLFVGHTSLTEALEVQSGVLPSALVAIVFDATGRLTVLESPSADALSVRAVDVRNELTVPRVPFASNPPTTCPYSDFETDIRPVYYLDMGETVSVTAKVTPRESVSNEIGFSVSDFDHVVFATEDEFSQTTQAIVARETTATLSETSHLFDGFENKLREGQSNVALRVSPGAVTVGCASIEQEASVRVGCPPNRHIRFKREQESEDHCDEWAAAGKEYSVPRGVYNEKGVRALGGSKEDLTVEYDNDKFGCPVRVYHGTAGYLPQLELWDGDSFVSEVTANFVVFDANGRWDFSYNSTVQQAGCSSPAQSRTGQREAHEDLSDADNWTPYLYETCFGERDVSRDEKWRDEVYEVMNSTGISAIRFLPAGRDGVFIFHATVVDPDYSYCVLETEFAILVFGAALSAVMVVLILIFVLITVLLLLTISYVYYRKKKLHVD